ncbi:MAG: nitrogenase component 1 [Rikenellaceae bacterium]
MNNSTILGVSKDQMRCPLSGAAKAISMIKGAAMIIIGTEECTYYTTSTLGMRGAKNNCFSLVLDNDDITFGAASKLEAFVEKVITEHRPRSLFLVTTCVAEVIGEHYHTIAEAAQGKHGIPVKVIPTCHFEGKNSEHGFELVSQAAAPFARLPNKKIMSLMKLFFGHSKKGRDRRPKTNLSTPENLPKPSYRMGLLWTLLEMKDAIVLEYGTAGTTAYAMKTLMMRGIDTTDKLFTTGLSQQEIVMGDTTRLENAILKLDDAYSPRRIFVLSSSISEVTGMDVKGVCNYMQEQVNAQIIAITGHGFGGDFEDGVRAANSYNE